MGGVPLENRNEAGERGMGKLYDIMGKAKADRDIEAFNRCYHDDWEFKFHSSGRIVGRGDNTDEQTLERWTHSRSRMIVAFTRTRTSSLHIASCTFQMGQLTQ